MKKILFIQSKFDFNQFLDEKIFPNSNDVEFDGLKHLNKPAEYFSKYTKIFSCDYSNKYAYSIIKKAKSSSVNTFLLMDGIYDWANLYLNPKWAKNKFYFDVSVYDLVYCVDSHTASYFNLNNVKSELYKPPRVFKISQNDIPEKEKIFNSSNKKILLTTAISPYFDEIEFNRIINIFASIIEWSKLNSIDLYYRIFNKKIISELKIEDKFNLTKGSIDNYLKNIDVLITTPSTVSVTAIMLDIPAVHIIYRDTPNIFQTAWQIFHTEMVPDILNSALKKQQDRMIHQRTIIPHVKIDIEPKKFISQNKIEKNFKFSKISFIFAILKSKLKGLYYKLFKY